MNCSEFARWLDEGRPAGERAVADAHAAACARCAAADERDATIGSLLAQRFALAPPNFTASVLARLPAARREFVPESPPDPYPWFVQILLEPSTVLGLVLGGVYAMWVGNLWSVVRAAATGGVARWLDALAIFPADVAMGLAWASLGIVVAGASWLAYRVAAAASGDAPVH
ncbi:MAG: hypothetical protein KC591_16960 [Gemmatimonadetes bacterium]|nr:hypothetical protein [Gemmatimonadota bacterium]